MDVISLPMWSVPEGLERRNQGQMERELQRREFTFVNDCVQASNKASEFSFAFVRVSYCEPIAIITAVIEALEVAEKVG